MKKTGRKLTSEMVLRAWSDPVYLASLGDEQRGALPANPSGRSNEEVLDEVVGGEWTFTGGCDTWGCGTACPTDSCTCTGPSCTCCSDCGATCYPTLCGTTQQCCPSIYPCTPI